MNSDEDLLACTEEAEDDHAAYEAAEAQVGERCERAGIKAEDALGFGEGTVWLVVQHMEVIQLCGMSRFR